MTNEVIGDANSFLLSLTRRSQLSSSWRRFRYVTPSLLLIKRDARDRRRVLMGRTSGRAPLLRTLRPWRKIRLVGGDYCRTTSSGDESRRAIQLAMVGASGQRIIVENTFWMKLFSTVDNKAALNTYSRKICNGINNTPEKKLRLHLIGISCIHFLIDYAVNYQG